MVYAHACILFFGTRAGTIAKVHACAMATSLVRTSLSVHVRIISTVPECMHVA